MKRPGTTEMIKLHSFSGYSIRSHIPNAISVIRIALSICLLLTEPFHFWFWSIYLACGFSDMADGYLARKFHAASKAGAVLDSLGDTVFAVIMTFLFLIHVRLPVWVFFWIAGILVIKLLSILVGYFKFHAFAALHTYANKAVGFLLLIGLPVYLIGKSDVTVGCLLMAATLAAAEECLLVVTAKELDRNVKSIFK